MKARFIKSEWENDAHSIASIYLRPDRPYYFTAGQYANLIVPHDNPDSRGLTRTMTLTSHPSDTLLRMTMRMPRRTSTFKQTILALEPNSLVTLTDPMGDLILPLDDTIPLLFVAGGVGIASYISMILWLTTQRDARDVTLLYTVRNTEDILFQEIFDAYDSIGRLNRLLFTTDNKSALLQWPGIIKSSRLTTQDIIEHAQPTTQIYISGAEHMVEQLQHELQDRYKIPQYRIAFDYFDGYTEL